MGEVVRMFMGGVGAVMGLVWGKVGVDFGGAYAWNSEMRPMPTRKRER